MDKEAKEAEKKQLEENLAGSAADTASAASAAETGQVDIETPSGVPSGPAVPSGATPVESKSGTPISSSSQPSATPPAAAQADKTVSSAEQEENEMPDGDASIEQFAGMIEVLWNMSVIDVESTLRAVCFKLFKDASANKAERVMRAKGMYLMGSMFMEKGVSAEEGIEAFMSQMREQMEMAKAAEAHKQQYEAQAAAAKVEHEAQGASAAANEQQQQQPQQPQQPQRIYTREELAAFKPKDLREILEYRGVSTADCLEKSDFINKIVGTN